MPQAQPCGAKIETRGASQQVETEATRPREAAPDSEIEVDRRHREGTGQEKDDQQDGLDVLPPL